MINGAAGDAPVDTIVVLMMENRSIDQYLGWLATDDDYLERGRSLGEKTNRIPVEEAASPGRRSGTSSQRRTFPLRTTSSTSRRSCCGARAGYLEQVGFTRDPEPYST